MAWVLRAVETMPVGSPAGRLAFLVLGSDYIVDLELSAAQAEGRGEILSSPRVITEPAGIVPSVPV